MTGGEITGEFTRGKSPGEITCFNLGGGYQFAPARNSLLHVRENVHKRPMIVTQPDNILIAGLVLTGQ